MSLSRAMAFVCVIIAVAATSAYGAWTWTTLDYPGATATRAYGVSGDNIIGYYSDATGERHGFVYAVSAGAWTALDYPGATRTCCHGIDGNNIVGDYDDASGNCHAFLYNGSSWTTLDYPGAAWTAALGISGNKIVGEYATANCTPPHGFLYNDPTWTTLDYPGATWTEAWGISGNNVVGNSSDGNSAHGFLYNGTSWTNLDFPGAGWTRPYGISGNNIVGYYLDHVSERGFLYDGSSWTNLDYPGASITYAQGVSSDTIVGYYVDASSHEHAFLLPIPQAPTGVSADVFNMGGTFDPTTGTWAGLASVQFVTVGDPGNAGDTGHPGSSGSVGYTYQIGMYAITAGQFCAFLNAVAQFSDTYKLYNTYMDVSNYDPTAYFGGGYYGCDIKRTGSSGSYVYSVAADWANRPVNYISWGSAARFCNWLANGQPVGAQTTSTTEDGAYYLNGAVRDSDLMAVARKANVRYVIPTADEWYKAAYYDADKPGGAGYWNYATRSDNDPSNVLDPAGTNNANYRDWTGYYGNGTYTIGAPYWRTEVGAFASSISAYGTFDQTGNVSEWMEATFGGNSRRMAGGRYTSNPLGAGSISSAGPSYGFYVSGFRVAYLPEPVPHFAHPPASFSHRLRQGLPLGNDQLSISNAGAGTLTYTIGSSATWVHVSPAGGSSSGGVANTHGVIYDLSSLAAGTYNGNLSIVSPDADNSPQTVSVTVIIDPPHIVCSPTSFTHHIKQTQSLPDDRFTVADTLTYTISSGESWFSVDPLAGDGSNGVVNTHNVTYSVSSLAVGTYTGSIGVVSPGADNSPQTMSVTVIVDPIPGDMDGDTDVDQTDFGLLQACLSDPNVVQPDPGCALAKLDVDSDVDSDDLAIFQRCLSGPNIPADPKCAR